MLTNEYILEAKQIREIIINKALSGGMHLSPSLGVVDVCVALHKVFDFNKDKLIFDIGHQRFPHLILQEKYRCGKLQFPDNEQYDMFSYPGFVGLSCASALGYSITYPDDKIIALVGDGALTAGEVFESLNHIGESGNNILVILNQNNQSIGPNVGALSSGSTLRKLAESLNFEYVGLADGHDIPQLIILLEEIRSKRHPVLFHIKTTKGKGYAPAETNPTKFHRPVVAFDKDTGEFITEMELAQSVFLKSMEILEQRGQKYVSEYKKVYFTAPACPLFSQLAKSYPNLVIDTGINEQHCTTLSTTLAALGNKVFMSIFAPFISRCYSQLYDLCHQRAPLITLVILSGINSLGATHQAVYTLGLLKQLPNAVIVHAANLYEYERLLDFSISFGSPIFIQIPKENPQIDLDDEDIKYGLGSMVKTGSKLTILPIGSVFNYALNVAKKFDGVEIINPRFLKPFDYKGLIASINKTGRLLIIEDGYESSGIGKEIICFLSGNDAFNSSSCSKRKNLNKKNVFKYVYKYIACKNLFPESEDIKGIQKAYGLTESACEKAVEELLCS